MAVTTVSHALERIDEMFPEKAILPRRVSGEVERLRSEMDGLLKLLKDAVRKPEQSDLDGSLFRRTSSLISDVENFVEECEVEIDERKSAGFLKLIVHWVKVRLRADKWSPNTMESGEAKIEEQICMVFLKRIAGWVKKMKMRGMADERNRNKNKMKSGREKIEELSRALLSLRSIGAVAEDVDRIRKKMPALAQAQAQVPRDPSFLDVVVEEEAVVVGIDDRIKNLEEILKKRNESDTKNGAMGVIPVWGRAGLGKTTLARRVYYSGRVRGYFDCFAWESMTRQRKPREVWEGILIQLTGATKIEAEKIRGLTDKKLAKELSRALNKSNKCLIVIDDIWSIRIWETITVFLQIKNQHSKIIVTTHRERIAAQINPETMYQHRPLPVYDAWKLLRSQTSSSRLHGEIEMKRRVDELILEMVEHCSCLPLTIKALGGVLASKHTMKEWIVVHKAMRLQGREVNGNMGVNAVLSLCYDHLPDYLKPCFLYLGQFPQDYNIPIDKLISMWIADGGILLDDQELEDLGERFVNELVQRCMVQVGKRALGGGIKTCNLHSLMRDLCLFKAREESCVAFSDHRFGNKWLKSSYDKRSRTLAIWLGEVAHSFDPLNLFTTSAQRNIANKVKAKAKRALFSKKKAKRAQSHLRCKLKSLLYISSEQHCRVDEWTSIKHVFGSFQSLKILDLEGVEAVASKEAAVTIPEEIGNLTNLKFFSIKNTNVTSVPVSIEKLTQLHTLDLRSRKTLEIPAVSKLQNLSNLYFPKDCQINGELQLPSSKLQILVYVPVKVGDHEKLTSLRKLVIHKSECYESFVEISSKLESFLDTLFVLTIKDTKIRQVPMTELEKLRSLRILKLWGDAFIGTDLALSPGAFPELLVLSLGHLNNLRTMTIPKSALPKLEQLKITYCNKFRSIPRSFSHLESLKRLSIVTAPMFVKELENRVREGGSDFYQIKHVRFCDILCSNK